MCLEGGDLEVVQGITQKFLENDVLKEFGKI